jgi:hypothetical protein
MAEKYSFINGVLGNDFLQQKTSDNIYLKDLLEQTIFPLIETYNNEVTVLERLLCRRFDDSAPNSKQIFTSSVMQKLSAIQQPGMRKTFDSWNKPVPICRYGDGTGITLETIKQMSSKQVEAWAVSTLVADKKNLIKVAMSAMCTKAPAAAVDELTHLAATPKAFWNDESGQDTPRTNGQLTFDGDHNHYIAYTGIGTTGANLDTLISRVTEHEGMSGQPILWAQPGANGIGQISAETTYWRNVNLVSGLIGSPNPAYQNTGIIQALVTGLVKLGFNVAVRGTWKEAIVIETPDLPAYYILCTMHVAENSDLAPLAWREHPQFKGLQLWSDSGSNPIIGLDAQYRRYLGMAVWNRDAGSVLYSYSGNSNTWAEPTFA